MISALKVRNFRYLWGGQFISQFGNVFLSVAALWLLQLRSPAYLAAAGVVMTLPAVLAAIGGALVDHFGPRRLMILTDLVRMTGVAGMALLVAVHPAGTPLFLLVALFLTSLGGALFSPSEMALVPRAVSEDDLASANGMMQTTYNAASTVGYAVGGAFLVSVGAVAILGFDALTYAVSAVSLLFVTVGERHLATGPKAPPLSLRSMGETMQTLRGLGWFLPILPLAVVSNILANGAFVLLPYWVHHELGGTAALYGLIVASATAGQIVGSLLVGSLGRLPTWATVSAAMAIQSILYAGFAFWPGGVSDGILLGAGAVANAVVNALLFTLLQKKIPREMHGRAFGLLVTLLTIGNPLGPVLAGLTATSLPLWWPWVGTAVAGLALSIQIARSRELRETSPSDPTIVPA